MKILFVTLGAHQSDALDIDPGLMMMSALARRAGHDTCLETFPDYRAVDEAAERISALDPDLLAVGVYSVAWYEHAAFIAGLRAQLDVPLICGGYQATCAPEETIAAAGVDFLCVGEGDIAFPQFLDRFASGQEPDGIPGIWRKSDGTVHRTGFAPLTHALDDLPAWDRELYSTPYMSAYHIQKFGDCVPIFTGRGCPYGCTFCSNPVLRELSGDKKGFLRKRSIASVVDEATRLVEQYDPDSFFIVDEQFIVDPRWLDEFCRIWGAKVGRKFVILSTTSSLPRPALEKLADAGLFLVGMGVEVGDDDTRRELLGKPFSNRDIIRAFDDCRALGIKTFAAIMLGLPRETAASLHGTCDLIERCDPDLLLPCVYNPLPGTALRKLCDRERLLEEVTWNQIVDRFGHQYSNKERQLMRVGEDRYLRVAHTHITEQEYLDGSDRVDRITHRIELRFFAREEEPLLRRRIADIADTPLSERRGVVALAHDDSAPTLRPLLHALGSELDATVSSYPWPLTDNPHRYAPALAALAEAPLGVVVHASGDDARALAKDVVGAGCALLAPTEACAEVTGADTPVVVDARVLYHGGAAKLCGYLDQRFRGRVRSLSLWARSDQRDATEQALMLLAKAAGGRLQLRKAWREPLAPASENATCVLATLAAEQDGPTCRLALCSGAGKGGERWRLTIETDSDRFFWSLGRHHELLLVEDETGLRRVGFDDAAPETTLARAFLVFALGEVPAFLNAGHAADACALATQLRRTVAQAQAHQPIEPDEPDILLRDPRSEGRQLLDAVAGRPGSLLAAPAMEGEGGSIFTAAAPFWEDRVRNPALFRVLSRWSGSAETLYGALARDAGGDAPVSTVEAVALEWIQQWVSQLRRADR